MSGSKSSLSSMTGYGRSEGQFEGWTWVWEVRAVNGKSLDMRLRLPPGFESLDPKIRKQISSSLGRGNLQVNLSVSSTLGEGSYRINENWLSTLVEKGVELTDTGKVGRPRLDGLYQVKGVVTEEIPSASDAAFQNRNSAILKSLEEMLASLSTARSEEGSALYDIMSSCLNGFTEFAAKARECAGAQPEHLKKSFDAKIVELIGESLPEDRLITEAAILAVKADVSEELDRLDAHIVQGQKLLQTSGPVGRKLDFLSQEFIREINTMCSKSTDIELTQIGLEMKSLIEQFREQAANVE